MKTSPSHDPSLDLFRSQLRDFGQQLSSIDATNDPQVYELVNAAYSRVANMESYIQARYSVDEDLARIGRIENERNISVGLLAAVVLSIFLL